MEEWAVDCPPPMQKIHVFLAKSPIESAIFQFILSKSLSIINIDRMNHVYYIQEN